MLQVKDLTIDELKDLISDTIKDCIEDSIEDLLALSSKKYLSSIEEAREDIKEGRVKSFEDVFGNED